MNFMLVVIAALESYVLGSISFAVIFSKMFIKKDVRNFGSGNAGMTNVVRVAGVLPGLLTFVFDVLKGFVACAIGKYLIFNYIYETTKNDIYLPLYGALFCGVFCILGHVFPVFFGFKGGKAVAVSVGIFAVGNGLGIIIALSIFALMLVITKIVSLSSVLAALTMLVCSVFLPMHVTASGRIIIVILTGIMCMIIILKHKDNMVRLFKGEEKPIFSKRS